MKSKHHSDQQRRGVRQIVLIGLIAIGITGTVAMGVLYFGQQSANAEPAIPLGVSLTSWSANGKNGEHVLNVVQGSVPAGIRVMGTLKTDTDCDPDSQGINHCHNVIALDSGGSIEVIHNHVMHRYPCLEPGQRLSIIQIDANWVMASEGQLRQNN